MILKPFEICQYTNCPYAKDCYGKNPFRKNVFECEYADDLGSIQEGQFRNPLDKTGKMKVILE